MIKKLVLSVALFIFCFYIYHPIRHAARYEYIADTDVLENLVKDNLTQSKPNLCPYTQIILNGEEVKSEEIYKIQRYATPIRGGEYIPTACQPLFKSAIIVPYRDRKEQLRIFLNYMHQYLQKQNIHYRIFIVEQNNTLPFNRAKLINYGAVEAMKLGYSCLILHDVDIIPLNSGNIYACTISPRHMCSSLDTFRFTLPYSGLFGGVVSIRADQYKSVNGMSNVYDGWGGEDDDLYLRLFNANLFIVRFSPRLSKYTMLFHKKQEPSADRHGKLKNSLHRQMVDGLNTLPTKYKVKLAPLFTHIITP